MAVYLTYTHEGIPRRHHIVRRTTTLGRHTSNDLAFSNADTSMIVSGKHAEITFDPTQGFLLRDLGSTNGTFHNGVRINAVHLTHGDVIELGHDGPRLTVEITAGPEEFIANSRVVSKLERPTASSRIQKTLRAAPMPPPPPRSLREHLRGRELYLAVGGFFGLALLILLYSRFGYLPDIDQKLANLQRLDSTIAKLENDIRAEATLENKEVKIAALNELIQRRVLIIDTLPIQEKPKVEPIHEQIMAVLRPFGLTNYNIPSVFVERVQYFLDFYATRIRGRTIAAFQRSRRYMPVIEQLFAEKNLPIELAYIAFIESEFVPDAVNPSSKATGMWQFMAPTAREHGLRVDKQLDERTDPVKSTRAARDYLLDLISVFGIDSFMLVLASYNAGDGIIRARLKKIDDPIKCRDFWYLVRMGVLKEETENYIPKFIAANILAKSPTYRDLRGEGDG